MRFSVVLFDLDGTVIDTNHLIVTTFQHVFREKLNLSVSAEEIYKYFGEPLPQTMARFAPDRANELTDFYRLFNLANHDLLLRQFQGMPETLSRLHSAGVKLGVVTSKRVAMARQGLRVSGLEHYFHAVVGMDETQRHKPDAEPALLALSRLGEQPGGHVLLVGDSKFDILCGRNAGIRTAAVGWTVQDRTELGKTKPDFWVESPGDLVSLVLEQNESPA
jgi:pyrophosphatase PpaX